MSELPSLKIKYSSVLEYTPLMAAQQYIWIQSLLHLGINPELIYVHIIGDLPEAYQEFLTSVGVQQVHCDTFDERNKYCNKLVQLDTFTSLDDFDYVCLMDCDTALVSAIQIDGKQQVYAKVVDFPCPPSQILNTIFKESGLDYQEVASTFPLGEDAVTEQNNCNGGLYIIQASFLNQLSEHWKQKSTWCIDNANLFTEPFKKHADQVGFALAMRAIQANVSPLPITYNYPSHVGSELLQDASPVMIHYHDLLDEHMRIKRVGMPLADAAIDAINDTIGKSLEVSLNNSMFWDLRYARYPELGSGVGSRGEILSYKQKLINNITYGLKDATVTDVGCGDLELTKSLSFNQYLGLDLSQESIKLSAQKRPDWDFKVAKITDSDVPSSDVVMCFDVLIHQSSENDFKEMVAAMVAKANKRLIIGAYNSPPAFSSSITYFYNGILDEVNKHQKFNEIGIMGSYRDVSVVVATKHEKVHNRDIESEQLTLAYSQVSRPDLLQYLVDVSRAELGFYTAHYPRVFEYSWLLEQLEGINSGRVLDLGAGVCPLPICLNKQGLKVITVDSHPTQRLDQDKANWNEWGFLDYSKLGLDIDSHNVDFLSYKTANSIDVIYSISVIEHIPRANRVKIINNAANILKVGGKLLLTIDLVPNTDFFWNLSENVEVEPHSKHGSIQSFKKELRRAGFIVEKEEVQRNIHDSRTDVYYVSAVFKNTSWLKRNLGL